MLDTYKNKNSDSCVIKEYNQLFIEKRILTNNSGSWEMQLHQACEVRKSDRGSNYGYHLSIVCDSSIHKIMIDKNLNILNINEYGVELIPNSVFY